MRRSAADNDNHFTASGIMVIVTRCRGNDNLSRRCTEENRRGVARVRAWLGSAARKNYDDSTARDLSVTGAHPLPPPLLVEIDQPPLDGTRVSDRLVSGVLEPASREFQPPCFPNWRKTWNAIIH